VFRKACTQGLAAEDPVSRDAFDAALGRTREMLGQPGAAEFGFVSRRIVDLVETVMWQLNKALFG